jgi:hypothetical protein
VDFSQSIGLIRVSINPAGLLVSRDGASLPGLLVYVAWKAAGGGKREEGRARVG